MKLISQSVEAAFQEMGYGSIPVKLTEEMAEYPITDPALKEDIDQYAGADSLNTYMRKMSQANALRKQYDDPAVLARIAIDAIQTERSAETKSPTKLLSKHVFIIRQLKRPEEVDLLRKVYGRQFILASAYAPEILRREQLCERMKRELSTSVKAIDIGHQADRLMDRDAREDHEELGQQLRDTFHLADVFIDGIDKAEMDSKLKRFVAAFFGRNDIIPDFKLTDLS
jgi:hypothetical protein